MPEINLLDGQIVKIIGDVALELKQNIAIVEIRRPPNNFFDTTLINSISEAFNEIDETNSVRALVLASQGKNFCAGADFSNRKEQEKRAERKERDGNPLYTAAVKLFENRKPIIGAIQGSAVGGGFGLSLIPDFRVVSEKTRFTANFVKLGFHPGFGLTHTLERLIGHQRASYMFLTGQRIDGRTACDWGLADYLTDPKDIREQSVKFAREIAENAPLALLAIRKTMRKGLAAAVKKQTDIEFKEQFRLQKTFDHKEGIKAVTERRKGNFLGK
tara:strand:- start:142 stop:960 length:819 start_codon:yes stop_codon:yes gene_type:complete